MNKKILVVGAGVLMSLCLNAFADSSAVVGTDVDSKSLAQNAGVNALVTSYGANEVKTTPGVGIGSFSNSFSSDYCAGVVQAGGSWMGGSVVAGGPVDKVTCVLLRVYERTQQGAASEDRPSVKYALKDASYNILCEVHPTAKKAMQAQGFCIDRVLQQTTGFTLSPVDAATARKGNYLGDDPVVISRLAKTQAGE